MKTAAMTYLHGPSAAALTERLRGLCDAIPRHAFLLLFRHSLGGIGARHYAVSHADARVVSTIGSATPFGGIRGASFFGFARDLEPESQVLRRIRLADLSRELPHLSIIAGADVLSSSPVSHALPGGEVMVLLV